MRVTTNLMFQSGVTALQNKQQELLKVQEQSLTGNRTNRPSDDPAGTFRHLLFESDLGEVQSLKRTTDFASQRLTLGDGHINQVHERMLEAQELVMRLANGHVGGNPNILTAASEEAMAIYSDIINAMNSELDEVPLFGGGKTRSPFDEASPPMVTQVRVQSEGSGPLNEAPADFTASVQDGSTVADLPRSYKITFLPATGQYQVDLNGIEQTSPVPTGDPPVFDVFFTATGNPPALDLGDGITFSLGAEPVAGDVAPAAAGDVYFFEVVPAYRGGTQDRPVRMQNGRTLPGNVTGSEVIEGSGDIGRSVNVLGAIAGLRGALLRADTVEVQGQLDRIQEARAQVSDFQAVTGIRNVQVDAVTSTLELDETTLQEVRALNVEADLFEVLSRLEQTSQAMQVMTIAEREVLNMSLIDLIR